MEHSERQEILRDIGSKMAREDVETLERHGAFSKEKILKILFQEGEGSLRLYIVTNA